MYNLNEYERQRRIAESTKKLYPPGTRIELISMKDPYAPVPAGTRGTVKFVDSMGTIFPEWGNTIEPLVSFPVRTHSESSHRKKSKRKTNLNHKLMMKFLMRIVELLWECEVILRI